ncbi:MAG: sulfatase-like hydrolase/transferase [Rikenellaceae bacterium]
MTLTSKELIAFSSLLSLSAAVSPTVAAPKGGEAKRPNIVFVLTDDQPFDLLGCTGHPFVKTPNIDRLAKEGVLFSNGHVSTAISNPSRTCMLTGRFERNHGVNFNSGTALSPEAWEECYPVVLRKNGYYTGYVGKNHTPVGEKGYETGLMDKSFDYWYGGHEHLSFYPKTRHEIFKGAVNETQVEVLEEGMLDFLSPNDRNLKGAIHFLDSRPTDQPFFLNVCFNLPHAAGTSTMKMKPTDPELYRTAYRDIENLPLPENYIARKDIVTPRLPEDVLHVKDRQTGYDYVDTPETLRERMIREMETVTGIDKLVGKLVAELKRQKIADNTIIIFSSDHGIFKGEYGLGGKALCYEITTKVPMIIYDPRAPKKLGSKNSDELVLSIDLSATMLDYAGVEIPKSYQGHSLVPMLAGEKESVRDWLFTENLWSTNFGNPCCESVQNKEWKYIRYYKNENFSATEKIKAIKELKIPMKALYGTSMMDVLTYRFYVNRRVVNGEEPVYEELFNLKSDPKEAVNLIHNNVHGELVEKLRKQCDIELKYARGEGKPRVCIIEE